MVNFLEDRKLIRILIPKGSADWKENCWPELLKGQYAVDSLRRDRIEKFLTLQRFQREVPLSIPFQGTADP